MKNKELIVFFKDHYQLNSDREVAFVLNIDAGFLSSLKNEKNTMPAGLKFRLLDHIQFSPDIQKIASCFININEHQVLLIQDLDRIQDIQKKRKGETGNFPEKNIKQIERLLAVQKKEGLSDEQLSNKLEITLEELQKAKNGEPILTTKAKMTLYVSIGYDNLREAVSTKSWIEKDNKVIQKNTIKVPK